jgi:hypothetical protein
MSDEFQNRTSVGTWKTANGGPAAISGHEQGTVGWNTTAEPEIDSPGGMHCTGIPARSLGASLLSDALIRVVAAIK